MKKVLFERKDFKEPILPRDEFVVEKVVELENKEFNNFLDDMLDDYAFIKEHKDLMFIDKEGVYHSILVTSKEADFGILVQSEGYDYARYSAYISKSDLASFINKKTLPEYCFTVWDINDAFVTYSKDADYETVFIRINFKYQTIEIYSIDEDGKFKEVDDGIHVDVIKSVIEILESGKIVIDFRGESNVKK